MARPAEQFEQLTAYLDGELSPAERAEVEAWIARDEDARRLLGELRRTSEAVRGLPRAGAPRDFAEALMTRLEREALVGKLSGAEQPAATPYAWYKPLALAASLILAVTLGWFAWPHVASRFQEGRATMTLADAESAREKLGQDLRGRDGAPPPAAAARRGRRAPAEPTFDSNEAVTRAPAVEADQPLRRRLETAGREDARERLALTGPAERGFAEVRPVPAAAPDVASIDEKLQFRQISNAALQSAPQNLYGNRITVEVDDPQAVPELVAHLEGELRSKRVPSLHAAPAEQMIDPQSKFYNVRVTPPTGEAGDGWSGQEIKDDASAASGEVLMVMNVNPSMVTPLIESLETCTERGQVQTNWIFNGEVLQNRDVAQFVEENLVVPRPTDAYAGLAMASRDDEAVGSDAAVESDEAEQPSWTVKEGVATASEHNKKQREQTDATTARKQESRPAAANEDAAGVQGADASGRAERSRRVQSQPASQPAPAGRHLRDEVTNSREANAKVGETAAGRATVERAPAGDSAAGQAAPPVYEGCVTVAIQIRANPALQQQAASRAFGAGPTSAPAAPSSQRAVELRPARPAQTTQPSAGGAPHAP